MRRFLINTFIVLILTARFGYAQGYRGIGEPLLDKNLMEMPAIHGNDIILVYNGFVINYNSEYLIPNWVAYELTEEEVAGQVPRARSFNMDLDYRGRQAMREDYNNSGWDKGHMAPSADMKWSQIAMKESFYLTNVCPQDRTLNGNDWHNLEQQVRRWAMKYHSIYVVCGPFFTDYSYGSIGEREVMIPDGFFKAVLRKEGKYYHSIAFVFQNTSQKQPLKDAVVSVNQVEEMIGFDLFTNLRNRYEDTVESQADWNDW